MELKKVLPKPPEPTYNIEGLDRNDLYRLKILVRDGYDQFVSKYGHKDRHYARLANEIAYLVSEEERSMREP